MRALCKPHGFTLDDKIMLRTVAIPMLCLLVVVTRGSCGLNRKERGADSKSGEDHQWSYDERSTGPEKWASKFPDYCGGRRQSPIEIKTNELDRNEDLDEIVFKNYDDDWDEAEMKNNGHTVDVTPGRGDSTLMIADGGLDDAYKLIGIHFHWGANSRQGSEHIIDGKKFPLEMHLVHMNINYGTKDEALAREDGLAVIGVLFELDKEHNKDLNPIIDQLDEVINEGDSVKVKNLKVVDLLPDKRMPYYRYEGSLTTPTCNEVVTWTIFKDTASISEDQLKAFRNLKARHPGQNVSERLVNNFRPIQKLNGREVNISPSSAQNIPLSASLTLGLAALVALLTFLNRV